MLSDGLHLVREQVPGGVVSLAAGHRHQAVVGDRDLKLPKQHPADLEGRVDLAEKIVEQPSGVAAGDGEGLLDLGPDLLEVAGDHGEQAAGGVGQCRRQRGRLDPNAQVSRVFTIGLPPGPGLGVEVDEKLLVEEASKPQTYKWPGQKLKDGSVADY